MSVLPPDARAPRLRGVRALFTARSGGVSVGPWASLNLARHVGDDPVHVERNREILRSAMGCDIVLVDQVHSADVVTVDEGSDLEDLRRSPRRADALVTGRSDVAVAVMVADCLPVLLADGDAGVVGAAHAGRRGLLAGVLQSTVVAMAALGADPARIRAVVGPSVCGRCYEVPEDMRAEADALLPGIASETSWSTPSLDLRAGAVRALANAGLDPEAIAADAPCTVEDESCFSYRRSPITGRFVGAIRRAA